MTPNAMRELVLERFETEWDEATDYAFENENFQPTDDDPYLLVSVREVGGGQDTLGAAPNRKFRRRGLITAEIRVPADAGTQVADGLAHDFRTIFEGVTFSEINCFNALMQTFGTNGKWYLVTIDVNFEYDETK